MNDRVNIYKGVKNMDKVKVESIARNVAKTDDIILRFGERIRLVFRPKLIDGEDPIHGCFLYQKKNSKESWEDYNTESLGSIKPGQFYKLDLHAKEISILYNELSKLQKIQQEKGIKYGKHEYQVTENDELSLILEKLSRTDLLNNFLKMENGKEVFEKIVSIISNLSQDQPKLILNDNILGKLTNFEEYVNIRKLENYLDFYEKNKTVKDESIWQNYFNQNPFILSQAFNLPCYLFQQKAYVGGKKYDAKGGNYVDFLYRNNLSSNITIIEIKTPKTPILCTKYRTNCFNISNEFAGSINQVLSYRDSLYTEFNSLFNGEVHTVDIKATIIIGDINQELDSCEKIKSFEIFRRNLRNTQIITFDELFNKINILISLLKE
jgi:hypothetical protein